MSSWTRVVAAAAAALPLFWSGTVYAQSGATQPGSTPPIARSPDCYERLPTDPINLALRDASTQSTLRLLAQNYRVNMVVTDDVTGTLTADFYRAPVRDVFQGILDANGLVCVKQGELLRVSTSERVVKDEKGRADAQVSTATRDAAISKRINDAQKEANDAQKKAAEAAIQLATIQVDQKSAEIQAKRGEIKQEIIRLKYQDPAIVANTVAAMVGLSPSLALSPCRLKKKDLSGTDDKLNVEAIDPAGGGGTSAAVEAEKSVLNFARLATGGGPYGPAPAAGPGVTGPPGGLGALPPFSALFGPQPAPPVAAPAPLEAGSGLGGFGRAGGGETSPTIRTHCPSNSLVLRLYDEQMKRVKEAIETQLDLLPPQVKIESRIELLDRTDLFALGVQWGGGGLLGINDRTAIVGRGFTSNQLNALGVSDSSIPTGIPASGTSTPPIPNAPLTNVIPVSGTTGLAAGGNLVNLPIASLLEGSAAGGGGGFAFGIIGSRMNLNIALEALRVQNRSQSLARPEVVVAENQAAIVSIGEEIPFATVSSAGTSIQFKDAVLRLWVSPVVICRDEPLAGRRSGGAHRIRLQVIVENATRGATVDLGSTLGSPPAINKQNAATDTMVNEGQRLVIGGITQLSTRDQTRKVPLLGDIPVLGWLFRQKGEDTRKRELVIFLTPTVLVQEAPRPPARCPVQIPTAAKAN